MITYLIFTLVGIVVMIGCMDNAVEGYEDEHGFHFGYPPRIEK